MRTPLKTALASWAPSINIIIIIYYYYYKSLLMGVWDQVTGAERAPESLESLLAGYLNYNTPLEFFNSLRQKASAEKRRL